MLDELLVLELVEREDEEVLTLETGELLEELVVLSATLEDEELMEEVLTDVDELEDVDDNEEVLVEGLVAR